MGKREDLWAHPQLTANLIVDNETASQDLITEPAALNTGGTYLFIDKLFVSVTQPSHGGGILELKDSVGDVKWRTNTDGVKDLALDFGGPGLFIGQNTGIKAVLSGSVGEQASVSIVSICHTTAKYVTHMTATLAATQELQTT